MKVITDNIDRHGRCPLIFSGAKNLKEIHEYLWKNYYGYKFAILFDETKDEYEEYDSKIYVYFLDEVAEELAEYGDYEFKKIRRY